MPATIRLGDMCSGHGCFSARPNVEGSPDVFINSKPAHRVGDNWEAHGCSVCPPHGGVTSSGSGTTFANGKPLARVGDPVSCGSVNQGASPDVFAD